MRDAADCFRQSWPDENPAFRRRWTEPLKPSRPVVGRPKSLEQVAGEIALDWRRGRPAA